MTTIMSVLAVWIVASIPLGILMGRMLKRAAAEQTVAAGADALAWQPRTAPVQSHAALARLSLDR